MVAESGVEPLSQENESRVLPLHNSAMWRVILQKPEGDKSLGKSLNPDLHDNSHFSYFTTQWLLSCVDSLTHYAIACIAIFFVSIFTMKIAKSLSP